MANLFLFTATYPYSNRETFLESEIVYLSKEFDTIYIAPWSTENAPARNAPDNVVVTTDEVTSRKIKVIRCFRHPKIIWLFLKDFINKRVFLDTVKFKEWAFELYVCANMFEHPGLKLACQKAGKGDIAYSYWGKVGIYSMLFLPKDVKKVSRFHGDWDLWEEKYNSYVPIRQKLLSKLDAVHFISEKGQEFMSKKYKMPANFVSRLGTFDKGVSQKSQDDVLRVVSCSSITTVKRVDLIMESICSIKSRKIIWTHIGGGSMLEDLKEKAAKSLDQNIEIRLLGAKTNAEVLQYYCDNPVDVFVNLSSVEGIPVSIMEAISFDIPVVATDVGGTSEIVNDETGILVSPNPSAEEVANAILSINKKQISPRKFWEKYYMADKNYTAFVQSLKNETR